MTENEISSQEQQTFVVNGETSKPPARGPLQWFGQISRRAQGLVVIAVFAVIGTGFLLATHAASVSPTVDFQVSTHQSSDSSSITSKSFSTKQSNELLVAFVDSDGPSARSKTQTFTSVAGAGLQWTLRARSNAQHGTAEIWQAVANTTVSNAKVTAIRAHGGYSGDITVVGFMGANTTANGATATSSAKTGAPTVSLTTTEGNSWVWGTGNDWDNATARVAGAGQSLNDQYVYKAEATTYWTQSQTNVTPNVSLVKLNDTTPTKDRWNFAAIEILPAKAGSTGGTTTPPTAPTKLMVGTVTASSIALSWTASTDSAGVTGYNIYRNGTKIGTSTSPSYTDTGLVANTAYNYYVVAYDSASNLSQPSSTIAATTLATTCPTGETGTPPNCTVPTGGGSSSTGYWQPAEDANWQWEIGTPLVTTDATLMGMNVTAYNGDTAPSDNPTVYDIDAIENPASTVSALHALGDHAICYIEVGTAGDYYTAAQEGVATTYYAQLQAAGDLSTAKLAGYPEYYININSSSAISIIESMIDQQCAKKGFDAVETDLDETFGGNEGATTPFTITQANEETYLTTLANYMHSIGLGWIAKNLDDTGSASFVDDMEPLAQGAISEQCNQYSSCSLLKPFLSAGKWIGNAEYSPETQAEFCSADNAADINGVLFNVNLDTQRAPCR